MLKPRSLLLTVAVVAFTLMRPLAQAKSSGVTATGAAAITARLDAATASGDVPAVVVLVTTADKVVYEHASGKLNVAGNVPLKNDAIFRIASMTKPVTSAAIMTLVESGKLKLDDRADQYVPAIGTMTVPGGLER